MATAEKNRARYRQKIKSNIKNNMKNVINGEFTSIKGGKVVRVPIDSIHIPHIVYGTKKPQGVGRGEGDIGTVIGQDDQDGDKKAGNAPGRHAEYVELSIEEIAEFLGEELQLPNIKPKGRKNLEGEKLNYNTISKEGPRSLRHKRRTLKNAIVRQIQEDSYTADDPNIILTNDDFMYKSWRYKPVVMNNAVVFYSMDVSGSMSREQLDIVKNICFWIESWLQKFYNMVDIRYIVHDYVAGEVDKERFYKFAPSGGTKISTAFHKTNEIIKESYPVLDWNIYIFYFGDLENWGEDDQEAISIIKKEILPITNQLGVCNILGTWSSNFNNFKNNLTSSLDDKEKELVVISTAKSINDCYTVIQEFLSKGN